MERNEIKRNRNMIKIKVLKSARFLVSLMNLNEVDYLSTWDQFRSTQKTATGALQIVLKYVRFLVPLQANKGKGYREACIYMRIPV